MTLESLEDSLTILEKNCGSPTGFCLTLFEEDDWSFVINLHALLESAISQLLTHAVGREDLRISLQDENEQ